MGNQTLSTNNKIDNKKKYFIVFICMFLQAVPYSIAQNIQPLFVPYVRTICRDGSRDIIY